VSAPPPRLRAARAVQGVLEKHRSLDELLALQLNEVTDRSSRSMVRRLSHGVLRDWPALDFLLGQLLREPPRGRQRLIRYVLAVGLHELRSMPEAAHAAVDNAVEATRAAGCERLTGLSNALLRAYQRRRITLEAALPKRPEIRFGYPHWLLRAWQQDWPQDWQAVARAGNRVPPITLRVNRRHWSRAEAGRALEAAGLGLRTLPALPDALIVNERVPIAQLPGFAEGGLSVQDGAAQLAVEYLALADGLRVLDACAAPGGKAMHVLERADVALTAVDSDARRLTQIGDNLERLGLAAELVHGDAARPRDWWDGRRYDRILIDAPCSATGVIRRHPDIRWLRRSDDLAGLEEVQDALLNALWPLLAPGGILVYATCSVLARENHCQARRFVQAHRRVEIIDYDLLPGRPCRPGRQILPGEHDLDGFYYFAVRRVSSGGR